MMPFKIGKIFIVGKKWSKEEELLDYIKKWESMSAKELLDKSIEFQDKVHMLADDVELPPWIIASVLSAAAQDIMLSPVTNEIIEAFRKYKQYVDDHFMKKEQP
jgi:hypothetical protein